MGDLISNLSHGLSIALTLQNRDWVNWQQTMYVEAQMPEGAHLKSRPDDDERTTFHPLIWEPLEESRKICPQMECKELQQVWFMGMHTDVGGGYKEQNLSDIPLVWLTQKAVEKGLRVYHKYDVDIQEDPNGVMHNSRGTALELEPYSPLIRRIIDQGVPATDLLGIAKGDLPETHWFHLGRLITSVNGMMETTTPTMPEGIPKARACNTSTEPTRMILSASPKVRIAHSFIGVGVRSMTPDPTASTGEDAGSVREAARCASPIPTRVARTPYQDALLLQGTDQVQQAADILDGGFAHHLELLLGHERAAAIAGEQFGQQRTGIAHLRQARGLQPGHGLERSQPGGRERAHLLDIGGDGLAAQEVLDLDLAQVVGGHAAGDDLEEAGDRASLHARVERRAHHGAYHLTSGARHGDDDLVHALADHDLGQGGQRAEDGQVGEALEVLLAVVVEEADGDEAEVGVGP